MKKEAEIFLKGKCFTFDDFQISIGEFWKDGIQMKNSFVIKLEFKALNVLDQTHKYQLYEKIPLEFFECIDYELSQKLGLLNSIENSSKFLTEIPKNFKTLENSKSCFSDITANLTLLHKLGMLAELEKAKESNQ